MSAPIPAPFPLSPPEQWPDFDDEFDLPPGVGLLEYSKARSSLASTLAFESDNEGDSAKKGQEDEEEDWDEGFGDDDPGPGKSLDVVAPTVYAGTVTRLGSRSPSLPPEEFDLGSPSARSSPLKLRTPIALPDSIDSDEWDFDNDDEEEKGATIKAPAGLGISNSNVKPSTTSNPNPNPVTPSISSSSAAQPSWHTSSSTSTLPSLSPSSLFVSPRPSTSTPSTSEGDSLSCPASPALSTQPSELYGEPDGFDDEILFPDQLNAGMLRNILERKKAQVQHKEEEPFESGLLISHDTDLSPSRLRALRRSATAAPSITTFAAAAAASSSSKNPSPPQTLTLHPRPRSAAAPRRPALTSAPPSSAFLAAPARATIKHQKSASRLQSPPPALLPKAPRRKASLGTILPSAAAGSSKPTHHPKAKTGSTSSSDSLSPLTTRRPPSALAPSPSRTSGRITPSPSSISRLTMPTASTLAKMQPARATPAKKQRGALTGIFPHLPLSASTSSSSSVGVPHTQTQTPTPSPPKPAAVARVLKRPRGIERRGRGDVWGTGKELDGIEDLPVSAGREGTGTGTVGRKGGLKRPGSPNELPKAKSPVPPSARTMQRPKSRAELNQRPKSRAEVTRPKSRAAERKENVVEEKGRKKGPTLIKNMGSVGLPRTQNGMRWNPVRCRWDGQEELLAVFDTAAPPARPALITHLTSSAVPSSPTMSGAGGGGVRVVGDMMFDPVRMCWLRRDGAEEEDVFAGVEREEEWDVDEVFVGDGEGESGTIRAKAGPLSLVVPIINGGAVVDPELVRACREAEERHRRELKGWRAGLVAAEVEEEGDSSEGRAWLWEIRTLATRDYGPSQAQ